jgi:curved DNA-binding protein CbpA
MFPLASYEILGVEPGSSEEEIKLAYREAAQKAHPDRKGGSAERMSEVNQAYQILSDPERRAKYDSGAGTETIVALERRAKDFLLHLAGLVIRTAPLSENMVILLIDGIGNQKKSLRESRAKTLSEIEDLRQRLRRLKGPPENFLEDLIKTEIKKGERLLPVYEADELVMGKALEILRDFSYEEDAPAAPSVLVSHLGQPIFQLEGRPWP